MPILETMLEEQKASGGKLVWSPSSFIRRLGKEIDNEESVYYWAYKVNTIASLSMHLLKELCARAELLSFLLLFVVVARTISLCSVLR